MWSFDPSIVGTTGPYPNAAWSVPPAPRAEIESVPIRTLSALGSGWLPVAAYALAATLSTVRAAPAASGGAADGSVVTTPNAALLMIANPIHTYHASNGTPNMGSLVPASLINPRRQTP